MDDDEFLRAFETGALSNRSFHHRDHLRMAWLYIRGQGPEVAAARIGEGLRRSLEDTRLPYRHWRREALHSAPARRAWIEPDLVALPF